MMRRFVWFLPLVLLGGCAERAARPDADIFGNALKDAARAVAAGRACDQALLAARREDDTALLAAVERLRRSGAPRASYLAEALTMGVASDTLAHGLTFDFLAERQKGEKRRAWKTRAAKYYRRTLGLAPDFPAGDRDSLNALGYFLADRGAGPDDFRRAEELTRRSLKRWDQALAGRPSKDPDLAALRFQRALTAHDSLAWALYRQRRYDEALREQISAVAAARTNRFAVSEKERTGLADMLYHLGKIQQALGRTAEARAAFEETLQIKPEHEDAKREL